jgi:dihydroxy-acid dehydratase
MQGGPIAFVEKGDRISIDIPSQTLSLVVDPEELQKRKAAWKRPGRKIKTGYMARYARGVSSASQGAVVK